MYHYIFFDLDGTLLNTLDDLAAAGNHTLRALGFAPRPVDDYRLLVGNGIETVIYGFLLTAVFGLSTDALLAGNQQSNQILVISHEHDRIAAEIVEKAHRGVTMLNGMGWYTKESSQVVMVICRKRETADILKIVRNLDPKAFVSVASVTGVYGQGFGIIDGGMLNGMKKN